MARRSGASSLFLEDGFLRSVRPGRSGEPTLSLLADRKGPYFDASLETDLESILRYDPLDDPAELARAADLIAKLRHTGVSKYNMASGAAPAEGAVLVIDQTHGDRAVAGAGAAQETFDRMLAAACAEHPGWPIVIVKHPETVLGLRRGYFGRMPEGVASLPVPVAPYDLLKSARAVYTVSSQLGFEAILAGHRPVVFGQAFYTGWGLSDDRAAPVPRRGRDLSPAQLALGVLVKYPLWYDPYHDRLSDPETVIAALAAQKRAYIEDAQGSVAIGMRLWKRASIARFFGDGPVRFLSDPVKARAFAAGTGRPLLQWGAPGQPAIDRRPGSIGIEDGFIRSRGLGAELVPAVSLVRDPDGIYYDPATPSRLEHLIATSQDLPAMEMERAARLRERLIQAAISKYNLALPPPELPRTSRTRILVVGQVEDDASIRAGASGPQRTNTELLQAARAEHPEAFLIYKPHPDVEAGLRAGQTPADADWVAENVDTLALIDAAEEIWTLTSLLGFEALIRGKVVVTLGIPFYAGWGLTRDKAPPDHAAFARRAPGRENITIDGLLHATLIGYPRYFDPVTRRACPVDVILDRLENDALPKQGMGLRGLSKLQGAFASLHGLWR
jgi:capsular polysaccharide export protein